MPNGTAAAVDQATRLEEIKFPDFTVKLVTDVFDALVSANLRQTQAYLELLENVAKSLTDYINDTKDDIGGEQILEFLATTLPPENPEGTTLVKETKALKSEDAKTLEDALSVPEDSENDYTVPTDALTSENIKEIHGAVARRIAANKYILLQEMVKQGVLRLVVENGTIETRLTFTTYGSSFYQQNASSYHRDDFRFRAKARTGALLSKWVKASASASYLSVNVRTTNQSQQDNSGSHVQIFGKVVINFKTDYLALS